MFKNTRILLLPFNLLYGLVIFVRNKFYDWGIFKSTSFGLPVICIGNLAVGGSGKTPTTEYLVRLLSKKYKIAILSRGYGRKTKGFVLADEGATAETIGDEPLQYYRKFESVTVAVCEERTKGIKLLKDTHDVILLDDAFQHRKIKAGYNILLFEFSKMQTWQTLLPAGNLRETFGSVKRAQAVLITKSPDHISTKDEQRMMRKVDLNEQQVLAFSHIQYQPAIHLYYQTTLVESSQTVVFMLAGIANPLPLKTFLESKFKTVIAFEYPDHHQFTPVEIASLVNAFEQHPATEKIIITTEKDGQRLFDNKLRDLLLNLPVYYLPIITDIRAKDKAVFDQKILDYVASAKRFDKIH